MNESLKEPNSAGGYGLTRLSHKPEIEFQILERKQP